MRIRYAYMTCLLGAALCTGWIFSARATVENSKETFLVIYRPGPGWLPGKPVSEQGLSEHFQYMLDLYEQGTLKQAGPFKDDSGGAVILEVADMAAAQAVVASDPAVKANKMTPEVRPWRLVPWAQHLETRKAKARPAR